MVDKKIIFLIACFFMLVRYCLGQPNVKKVNKRDRAYLEVRYDKYKQQLGFDIENGNKNNYLTDIEKFQLIGCLLKFEGDITKHSGRVYPVYFGNSARNIRFSPKSKYFTIEIDALYYINRIAYGVYTDYYSPAPVLYDNEEEIEINDRPEKVKVVFVEYKKWFDECMKTGKISKYFPFNDGRYVWLYGKKSRFSKDEKLIE